MKIQVMGPGCYRCQTTYNLIERVIRENKLEVQLEKVSDMTTMISMGILSTPAVVIDGKVVVSGRVPRADEITQWIQSS